MVDKAQPSSRMFEEHVRPLLARLPLFVMENVFRFESLIYGQVNGIIGIRYASRGVYGRIHDVVDLVDHVHRFLVGQHLFLLLFLPRSLDRRRHSPVVRLREVGRSLDAELVKERKLLGVFFIFASRVLAPLQNRIFVSGELPVSKFPVDETAQCTRIFLLLII